MREEEEFEAINRLMDYGEDHKDELEIDDEADDDSECCSNGCMECLGMTWRDFA